MGIFTKEQLRELIREKNLVTTDDVQNMLKEMFAETIQEIRDGNWTASWDIPRTEINQRAVQIDETDTQRKKYVPATGN
jgi:hypothetical protein